MPRHDDPKTNTDTDSQVAPTNDACVDQPGDSERRAALARLGALAAWTAPTMLTLMLSTRASAQSTQATESLPGTPQNF